MQKFGIVLFCEYNPIKIHNQLSKLRFGDEKRAIDILTQWKVMLKILFFNVSKVQKHNNILCLGNYDSNECCAGIWIDVALR